MEFAKYLIDFLVYLALAASISWFFFFFKRFDLIGGFIGGAVVGLIGSILGGFILQPVLPEIIKFLQNGFNISNVNVINAAIGGIASVMLLSKINNGRKRKDY
jgi:uncharacterized membrane protein YeaQ/YmgE (transglycosylase-associated protein family)